MSNLDAVNALVTAINFDRFEEIEARHQPDVVFETFRGPAIHGSVAVADWHRTFQQLYADCTYTALEFVDDGDTVCLRATIEAKGYDWRAFEQRVVEVFRMADGVIAERRLYAMLRDVEFDKQATAALAAAREYRGGSVGETRAAVEGFLAAVREGDLDAARGFCHDKMAMVDGVYGSAGGGENVIALMAAIPRPALGLERMTHLYAGGHDALVEFAVNPERPRGARWFRLVEGKIVLVEGYWMLREIGLDPREDLAQDRHRRQVILPI